ncbi:uncharacterized protein C7orf31 [Polyodon spathula]|uniref:uncharacterized protein C7orf31 n=1 Tax=Polyodon spathula TaxID=7913 RepID=UPI001B7E5F50|nr:uncharacterized protein C7orf31 [Polyodon spathula]
MGNAKVQDLSYYYRQDEGSGILSKTFQSSEQLTPLQIPHRHTVSQDRYRQYWENAPKVPRCLWGRDREYAGIGPISLPEDHRPKMEPPPVVMKGHRHHGYGGDVWPTSVTIPQYYDLTMMKKSNVRTNDQLVPKPPDAELHEKQIHLQFPAEHPYQSHISRFAVFPNFKSPDDPDTGVRARNMQPIQPFTPAKAPDVIVLSKTRGTLCGPYRHEIVEIPSASNKKGLIWPGQYGYYDLPMLCFGLAIQFFVLFCFFNYCGVITVVIPLKMQNYVIKSTFLNLCLIFQFPKSAEGLKQVYYPKPPKTVAPNASLRSWETTLPEKTVNMLKNLERSQWLTSYKLNYTGRGPMNPVQLDDYHEKIIADVTGEINPYTAELKERSCPVFSPPRPREGRYSRLLHGLRKLEPHPTEYNKSVNEARSKSCKPEGQYIAFDKKHPTERPTSVGFERTEEVQPPRPDVCYEDLSCSGKEHYTVEPHPCSLNQSYLWSTFKNPLHWKAPISEVPLQDAVYPSTFHLTECEQRPASVRLHAAIKESGSEVPRPQTAILKLQDSFTKSGAHRRFHEAIKGEMMDLRKNIHTGRRHNFFGFNSYYYH